MHSKLLICAATLAVALAIPRLAAADNEPDFSPAERALFMENQFGAVKPPATLNYSFRKSGSLEPGFDDKVSVALKTQPDGACCAAVGEFLSGTRRMQMPDIEGVKGNPVTMYFLEHDVREMERLTKGKQNYFRKQIRLAIYKGANLRDVSLQYRGKTIAGREIVITPYLADPNRQRFEKFVGKEYVFTLSEAVPGGIVGIRTRIPDASADAPPLIVEEMWIDGADAKASKPAN